MASWQTWRHISFHSSHTTGAVNQCAVEVDTEKLKSCHEIIAFKATLHEAKHIDSTSNIAHSSYLQENLTFLITDIQF